MRTMTKSQRLFREAQKVIAGGVSSDIRRPTAASPPLYVDRGSGSRIWDVDENEYIDYVLGQGPLIFGHSHPRIVEEVTRQLSRGQVYSAQHELEIEVANLITQIVPCAEKVRFNSTGSEAVHGAMRLARGLTSRRKIVKFEGHYHGWYDGALFSVQPSMENAGDPRYPNVVPGTKGQPQAAGEDLLIAPWNDLIALGEIVHANANDIAAVIMEPILCNTGCIEPVAGFLEGVREITRKEGIVLIFDEVITGFRVAPGGAQELYDVTPDLAVFGKAIAGGFPLSCIAGTEEAMQPITEGTVGHSGTFNSNPVVMSAAACVLNMIAEDAGRMYPAMRELGTSLAAGVTALASNAGIPLLASGPGPVVQIYQTQQQNVNNYREYAATDLARAARFHSALMDKGVNSVGRGLWLMSTTHTEEDVKETLAAVESVVADDSWCEAMRT